MQFEKIIKFYTFPENLRLKEKEVGKNKKHEKVASTIVKNKKKKEESKKAIPILTAEDRAKRALDNMISYQIRSAKRRNKPKKIRCVVDENDYNATKSKGITSLLISILILNIKRTDVTITVIYYIYIIYVISGSRKRPRSWFDVDLTDTSKKGVKRMRYE